MLLSVGLHAACGGPPHLPDSAAMVLPQNAPEAGLHCYVAAVRLCAVVCIASAGDCSSSRSVLLLWHSAHCWAAVTVIVAVAVRLAVVRCAAVLLTGLPGMPPSGCAGCGVVLTLLVLPTSQNLAFSAGQTPLLLQPG